MTFRSGAQPLNGDGGGGVGEISLLAIRPSILILPVLNHNEKAKY